MLNLSYQLTIFDFIEYEVTPKKIKPLCKGLVYLGAKRKIAFSLLQKMAELAPQANNFYDMFGGGASMSLIARHNEYNTFYNELDKGLYSLVSFLFNNKELPREWLEFVNREKFNTIKEQVKQGIITPYNCFVLLSYSFGSDMYKGSYFCAKEKEIFKEKGHYFILDNSKECAIFWDNHFKDKCGLSGVYLYMQSDIYPNLSPHERRHLFVDITLKMEAIAIANVAHLFQKQNNADTYKAVKDISQRDLCRLIDKHNPHLPKKNYKLSRLKQLQQLQQLDLIAHTNLDYAEVKITTPPHKTIIYCDPPYKNTNGYLVNGECSSSFDYERFYAWCIDKAKQGYKVFISEYDMPQDRFAEVWSKETSASFNTIQKECGAKVKPTRTEKLFIPKAI